MKKTLRVDLSSRSYEIIIGENLIAEAGKHIQPLLKTSRAIIVTDASVAGFYLASLEKSLNAGGIKSEAIILPAGEKSKSFASLEKLCSAILNKNIDRKTMLIALGGGVIGDLTGFAASILLRGIDFMQIPTTLLAMVDSSVGGKTGINTKEGKNLVGSFYQPRLVLADISALSSLDNRQFLAGFAEVIKYGLITDRHFFDWLERHLPDIISRKPEALTHIVSKSAETKAEIVAKDEKEQSVRALLNFGHTFGHALEIATGFSTKLLHGEGVAIGMALAFKFSAKCGLCSAEAASQAVDFIKKSGLPYSLSSIKTKLSGKELLAHMEKDKKVADGKLTFILARAIGDCFVANDVEKQKVLQFLEAEIG